ncbi:MAG: mechanosensitive ion channel [Anaerolineaceae bacterium]|nr:mechanosensitive ion channel [Anaerolineaceae bacterium]
MLDNITLLLSSFGITDLFSSLLAYVSLILIIILISSIVNFISKRMVLRIVKRWVQQTGTEWDDILLENGVFEGIAQLLPILVIYISASIFPLFTDWIQRITLSILIFIVILILDRSINALNQIYETYEVSKDRPIKGYLQIAKIAMYIFGIIIIIATIIDESPLVLLGGLSAMTAVLMLIFKDTILGFVASIQLAMNDLIHIGDWIEMPQFGADGDVIEITVNTVKIRNFDNTIVTIPTYSMISDSFKNWRGMSESKGRRIKRAIIIDLSSIRYCDEKLLEKFINIDLIKTYINSFEVEQETQVNKKEIQSEKKLTNIGAFRAYCQAYLENHPMISQQMTLLIRQLPLTSEGMPIEIYAFSKDKDWIQYEKIQADIIDHLIAILPEFELEVYQSPSGEDIRSIVLKKTGE